MQSACLPKLPATWSSLRMAVVGNAARLRAMGVPIHLPPELLVEADHATLAALDPSMVADETLPGFYLNQGWRVTLCSSTIEETLAGRAIPVDAFGVFSDGTIVDPLDGIAELKAGRMTVPTGVFQSDPTASIRVPALASQIGVKLDSGQLGSLSESVGGVFDAPRDEVREWLTRLLVGKQPAYALQVLYDTGVLQYMLPEVAALVGFHRSSRHHHKDVWDHTKLVVRQAMPRPEIRWAALLHDIGKVFTRSYTATKKVHFFCHDHVGAYMFEGIAARLRFSSELSERVRLLILHHLRPAMYESGWSESAVRRFANQMDGFLPDLLDLARSDITSKRAGTRRRAIYRLHELKERIGQVVRQDAENRQVIPQGLGRFIVERLGIPPGPRVGDLRRRCEAAVREGLIDTDATIDDFIEFLRRELAA